MSSVVTIGGSISAVVVSVGAAVDSTDTAIL